MRLRNSARAVIGVAAAVALAEACGLSLTASITGGLAALLALFTVLDADVRAQRLTTALLPVAGFPVLTLATTLHGVPLARDATFLAVVFAGVYARRFGPRGHALGIFGFMMFFVTQFLHARPAQLPELYAAVGLALLAAGAVRFVLWPIERRTPPPRPRPACPGPVSPDRPPDRPSRPPPPAPSRSASARRSPTTAGTGPSAPPGGSS